MVRVHSGLPFLSFLECPEKLNSQPNDVTGEIVPGWNDRELTRLRLKWPHAGVGKSRGCKS
jgi:hypothetical protein